MSEVWCVVWKLHSPSFSSFLEQVISKSAMTDFSVSLDGSHSVWLRWYFNNHSIHRSSTCCMKTTLNSDSLYTLSLGICYFLCLLIHNCCFHPLTILQITYNFSHLFSRSKAVLVFYCFLFRKCSHILLPFLNLCSSTVLDMI